jgi:hypothetical protein
MLYEGSSKSPSTPKGQYRDHMTLQKIQECFFPPVFSLDAFKC